MLEDPYYTKNEVRHERHFLSRVVVAVIIGLFIAGALYSALVRAEPVPPPQTSVAIPVHVYEQGGTAIRLMPGPCVDAMSSVMIARGAPAYLERFRAIESTWPMRDGSQRAYGGCWAELTAREAGVSADQADPEERVLLLLFEDGQTFAMRKRDFVKTGSGA